MNIRNRSLVGPILLIVVSTQAAQAAVDTKIPILSDPKLLKKARIPILLENATHGLALAEVTPKQEANLSHVAHEVGRCGGYEALNQSLGLAKKEFSLAVDALAKREEINSKHLTVRSAIAKRPEIELAVAQVREADLETHVKWLSSFPTRRHNTASPNVHVDQLETRLKDMTKNSKSRVTLEQLTHQNTRQRTLMARIVGSSRAGETIVLGAHLDSTTGFLEARLNQEQTTTRQDLRI